MGQFILNFGRLVGLAPRTQVRSPTLDDLARAKTPAANIKNNLRRMGDIFPIADKDLCLFAELLSEQLGERASPADFLQQAYNTMFLLNNGRITDPAYATMSGHKADYYNALAARFLAVLRRVVPEEFATTVLQYERARFALHYDGGIASG